MMYNQQSPAEHETPLKFCLLPHIYMFPVNAQVGTDFLK